MTKDETVRTAAAINKAVGGLSLYRCSCRTVEHPTVPVADALHFDSRPRSTASGASAIRGFDLNRSEWRD